MNTIVNADVGEEASRSRLSPTKRQFTQMGGNTFVPIADKVRASIQNLQSKQEQLAKQLAKQIKLQQMFNEK